MARGFNSDTTLGTIWSKMENDYKLYYPAKEDGWLLHELMKEPIVDEFIQELDKRGYDTTTLRFSIKRKQNRGSLTS